MHWESSIDNFVTKFIIANTAATLNFSNLTQTTKYRAVVQNGVCQSLNSVAVSVTVLPLLDSPIVQRDVTVNLMKSVTLTATGCEAGTTLHWFKSVDNALVMMPVMPIDTTKYYAKCQKIEGELTCISNKSGDVIINIIPVIVSIATGDWESPATWNAGRVPKNGDFVIVDQDHIVTLNGESSVKKIDYRGTGTLKYQSASSKLNTGL